MLVTNIQLGNREPISRSRVGGGEPGSLVGAASALPTKGSTMHASDIQVELPLVDRATTAVDAARLIAENHLSALVVANPSGKPVAVVSSADVLGLLVPNYVLEDMALAGVFDEAGAEEMWNHATDRTIGELLDDDGVRVRELLRVDADSTMLEIAALMVDTHAQIAAVRGTTDRFVTLPAVMDAILTTFREPGASA
jgi:CBS domain-containing protein